MASAAVSWLASGDSYSHVQWFFKLASTFLETDDTPNTILTAQQCSEQHKVKGTMKIKKISMMIKCEHLRRHTTVIDQTSD